MKSWYLDYAAATPVDPRVLRAMRPYFSEKFGNPGSLHLAGAVALKALDEARARLAQVTGTEFRDVAFTASATEANNLALRGVVRAAVFENQNSFLPRIIVSAVEHDSVLETARDMERSGEVELAVIPVDKRGVVDLAELKKTLDERTVLVSVMYVNNEIGTVQPITEIAEIIKNFKAHPAPPLFHVDAAQAFLYYPCNMKELGADLMTLSSQKIYGPKGAGALVGKLDKIHPLITGGGQEFGLRAGTENVPAIVGFGAAAEYAERERKKNATHAARVRDVFVKEIKKSLLGSEENVEVHLPAGRQTPHITNIAFPKGISSEDLLVLFDREGVAASPGAACSARALALSHVLRAIGLPDERIRRSIRFSFGRAVTADAAKRAARKVVEACRYLLDKKS